MRSSFLATSHSFREAIFCPFWCADTFPRETRGFSRVLPAARRVSQAVQVHRAFSRGRVHSRGSWASRTLTASTSAQGVQPQITG